MKRRLRTRLAAALFALLTGSTLAAVEPEDRLATKHPVPATELAPGVFMVQGAAGEPDVHNLARVGNAGFIVGSNGVVAIDTGTSYRQGVGLLASIHRVTSQPVRLALITHARQEFIFGAAAFQAQGIPVQMQRNAAGLMRSRCERCLATLEQMLGADAMNGSRMFTPELEFEQSHSVAAIGRPIRVLYFGHSSGPGAIAVFDEFSGVLFAGGLLDNHRVPDIQDADLDGWLTALHDLHALPITRVVPGHGPPGSSKMIEDIENYLMQLRAKVLDLVSAGTALSDAADAAALPQFSTWDQYDVIHRRNASILFVRLERELLLGPEPARH